MSQFDYSRMDPAKREHFVYRCYDNAGRLLYVGCSMNLDRRKQDHRASNGHRWFHQIASTRLSGPYNYDTARRLEKEAIYSESPLWNFNEPNRTKARMYRRRVEKRWSSLYLADPELSMTEALAAMSRRLDVLMPDDARGGTHFSDADVKALEALDRRDRADWEAAREALARRLNSEVAA